MLGSVHVRAMGNVCNSPHRVEAVESRQQRVLVRVEVLEVGWQHAPAYAHHRRDSARICAETWWANLARQEVEAAGTDVGGASQVPVQMWEG